MFQMPDVGCAVCWIIKYEGCSSGSKGRKEGGEEGNCGCEEVDVWMNDCMNE